MNKDSGTHKEIERKRERDQKRQGETGRERDREKKTDGTERCSSYKIMALTLVVKNRSRTLVVHVRTNVHVTTKSTVLHGSVLTTQHSALILDWIRQIKK